MIDETRGISLRLQEVLIPSYILYSRLDGIECKDCFCRIYTLNMVNEFASLWGGGSLTDLLLNEKYEANKLPL